MDLSEDLAQLEQGLREAEPSGRQLRYYLLRHFSELVQHLTCSLESDVQPDLRAGADKQPQAATSTQPKGGLLETDSGRIGGQGAFGTTVCSGSGLLQGLVGCD